MATEGTQPNDSSFVPTISASGRFVAFASFATNLIAGDTNQQPDVFLRDRGELTAGVFDLTPTDLTVAVHERLNYALTWTVPDPLNWHDLQFLQFRIRDDQNTVISVLWDEASNTFSLLNQATGQFGNGFAPGAHRLLQTPQVTLYLADTSVVGSGPTGPSVTLNLLLSLKPQAAGRTFAVEVAASDDQGHADDFAQAGTLMVMP